MIYLLTVLFIVVPILELKLLIALSERIGFAETVAIVIVTGIVGAQLARSQGIRVMLGIQQDLETGKMPGDKILSGALVLVGGVLLITPGIMTDLVGLSLMVPFFRSFLATFIKKFLASRFQIVNISAPFAPHTNEEQIKEVDAVEVDDEV